MKDVPTQIGTNLQIAAIPEREDARDALISNSVTHLNELPVGALVGSGSLRRQAQILALRPDLKVMDIRGNLDTRLKKLESGDYDAIILACAGLRRLGLENRISSRFEYTQMLPAPGQGALAVEIRINDTRIENMVATLNHAPTALAVSAERSFLIHMGGGCNVPVAAHACVRQDMIEVDALVSSPDGRRTVRDSVKAKSDQTNEAVAALSDRILSRGGREILNEIL
jgi:hydroxymethylbilane synthase